jgi:hypothetical protein
MPLSIRASTSLCSDSMPGWTHMIPASTSAATWARLTFALIS